MPVELDAILARLHLPPISLIERIPGGSAEVFRLDLVGGTRLLLKTYNGDNVDPHKDAFAAGLLGDVDVPVTRFLLVDDSKTRLPYRFAVTTYLEGKAAQTCLDHRDMAQVFRQIGALARKLHGIALPAFGELPQPAYTSNAHYVRGLAATAFERFTFYGGDPKLTGRLQEVFERDFDEVVRESRQPVFAHDDLQPNNVLVTDTDGQLTLSGLIDLGNARASCSVMDLAKTLFCCEHSAPGCSENILAGYGSVDHSNPARALEYYTMLHRIIMWWWLRHVAVLPTHDAPNDIMPALELTAEQA